jgi:hydrogenase maturation factor HypF (carbamoyltransferase family)
MTEREQVMLWINSFMKTKEPMVLVPKVLIRRVYDILTNDVAIEPIMVQKENEIWSEIIDVPCCGKCRQELERYPKPYNYCPSCGKAVKWE